MAIELRLRLPRFGSAIDFDPPRVEITSRRVDLS